MPNETPSQPEPLTTDLKQAQEKLASESPEAHKEEITKVLKEVLFFSGLQVEHKEIVEGALAALEDDQFNPQALQDIIQNVLDSMGIEEADEVQEKTAVEQPSDNSEEVVEEVVAEEVTGKILTEMWENKKRREVPVVLEPSTKITAEELFDAVNMPNTEKITESSPATLELSVLLKNQLTGILEGSDMRALSAWFGTNADTFSGQEAYKKARKKVTKADTSEEQQAALAFVRKTFGIEETSQNTENTEPTSNTETQNKKELLQTLQSITSLTEEQAEAVKGAITAFDEDSSSKDILLKLAEGLPSISDAAEKANTTDEFTKTKIITPFLDRFREPQGLGERVTNLIGKTDETTLEEMLKAMDRLDWEKAESLLKAAEQIIDEQQEVPVENSAEQIEEVEAEPSFEEESIHANNETTSGDSNAKNSVVLDAAPEAGLGVRPKGNKRAGTKYANPFRLSKEGGQLEVKEGWHMEENDLREVAKAVEAGAYVPGKFIHRYDPEIEARRLTYYGPKATDKEPISRVTKEEEGSRVFSKLVNSSQEGESFDLDAEEAADAEKLLVEEFEGHKKQIDFLINQDTEESPLGMLSRAGEFDDIELANEYLKKMREVVNKTVDEELKKERTKRLSDYEEKINNATALYERSLLGEQQPPSIEEAREEMTREQLSEAGFAKGARVTMTPEKPAPEDEGDVGTLTFKIDHGSLGTGDTLNGKKILRIYKKSGDYFMELEEGDIYKIEATPAENSDEDEIESQEEVTQAEQAEKDPAPKSLVAFMKNIVFNKNDVDEARKKAEEGLSEREEDLKIAQILENDTELQSHKKQLEQARTAYIKVLMDNEAEIKKLQKKLSKAQKNNQKGIDKLNTEVTQGDIDAKQQIIATQKKIYERELELVTLKETALRKESGQSAADIAYRTFETKIIKEQEALKKARLEKSSLVRKALAKYGSLSWGKKRMISALIMGGVTVASGGAGALVVGTKFAIGSMIGLGNEALLQKYGLDTKEAEEQAGYYTLQQGMEAESGEGDETADEIFERLQGLYADRQEELEKMRHLNANGKAATFARIVVGLGLLAGGVAYNDLTSDAAELAVGAGTDQVDNATSAVDTVSTPSVTQDSSALNNLPTTNTEAITDSAEASPAPVVNADTASTSSEAAEADIYNDAAEQDTTKVSSTEITADSTVSDSSALNNGAPNANTGTEAITDSAETSPAPVVDTETVDTPESGGGTGGVTESLAKLPSEAIVQKGDGISQIIQRQLDADTSLMNDVYKVLQESGFNGEKGSPEMYRELMEKYGYMTADGKEIRISADMIGKGGYQITVEDGAIKIHEVNLDGNEQHVAGAAFEGKDFDKGEYLFGGEKQASVTQEAVDGWGGELTEAEKSAPLQSIRDNGAQQNFSPTNSNNNSALDLTDPNLNLQGNTDIPATGDRLDLTNPNLQIIEQPNQVVIYAKEIAKNTDMSPEDVQNWYEQAVDSYQDGEKAPVNKELSRVLKGKDFRDPISGEKIDLERLNDPRSNVATFIGMQDNGIPADFFKAAPDEVMADEALKNQLLAEMSTQIISSDQITMLQNIRLAYGDIIKEILVRDPDLGTMKELLSAVREARAEDLVTKVMQETARTGGTLPKIKN